MPKLLILASVTLLALASLAVACGGGNNNSSSGSSNRSSAGPDVAPAGNAPGVATVQDITLKAGETGAAYFINPKEIKLKPGQVKVTMTNDGPERPHNFVVRNLNGQGDLIMMDRLMPGQTANVSFAVVAGTYQFLCTLPGHADRGAQGTLVVAN